MKNKTDSTMWLDSGLQCSRLGKYSEAMKCYEKAIDLNHKNDVAWFNKGTLLMKLGESGDAIKCLEKAIKIFHKDADYYINLGQCYLMVKEYKRALKIFMRALKLGGNDNLGTLYFNIGASFGMLGSWDGALFAYNEAIKINQYDYQAYFNRAVVLIKLGKLHQALEDIDQSIILKPDQSQAINLRAVVETITTSKDRNEINQLLETLDVILS